MGGEIDADTSLEELAAIVGNTLAAEGVEAVLSGGSAVTVYCPNKYQSGDLDFVTNASRKDLDRAMKRIGFVREGRHYRHPDSVFFVEFPAGPLAVGDYLITDAVERRTERGAFKLLSPTHSVMDRLAAFFHWNDLPSLDQAIWVAMAHSVDLKMIEKWSKGEGMQEKFEIFRGKLRQFHSTR